MEAATARLKGEMAEKGGDLCFAHGVGMAFSVEENEASNPIQVCLLGADTVVFDLEVPANAIEQFAARRGGERRWRSGRDHEERQ